MPAGQPRRSQKGPEWGGRIGKELELGWSQQGEELGWSGIRVRRLGGSGTAPWPAEGSGTDSGVDAVGSQTGAGSGLWALWAPGLDMTLWAPELERALERTLWAPRLERALERTLWAPRLEWALWAPGLVQALEQPSGQQ